LPKGRKEQQRRVISRSRARLKKGGSKGRPNRGGIKEPRISGGGRVEKRKEDEEKSREAIDLKGRKKSVKEQV